MASKLRAAFAGLALVVAANTSSVAQPRDQYDEISIRCAQLDKLCTVHVPMESSLLSEAAKKHYDAGHEAEMSGKLRKALSEYFAARRIDSDNALLPYQIGVVYRELGDINRAIQFFEASVRTDPCFLTPYSLLAELYGKQGNIEKAQFNDSIATEIEQIQKSRRVGN